MTDNSDLLARFRAILPDELALDEKRMMGGTVFMLKGNMLGGARRDKSGEAHFMFRVGKDNEAAALEKAHTRPMIHGGRKMGGFFFVDEAADDATLESQLRLALAFVSGLPPK